MIFFKIVCFLFLHDIISLTSQRSVTNKEIEMQVTEISRSTGIDEATHFAKTETEIRAELNKYLASLEMSFPKYQTPSGSKTFRNFKKKALRGGSYGPMTATGAHLEKCRQVCDAIVEGLLKLGILLEVTYTSDLLSGIEVRIPLSKKKTRIVRFDWHSMAAYSVSMNYDSYYNYWFVYTFEDNRNS